MTSVPERVTPAEAPGRGAVERLYAAASAVPPLSEPPEVAQIYADTYEALRGRPDTTIIVASENDDLIGLCYGHPWRWADQDHDAWAGQLREHLGAHRADALDGTFAVRLLAVLPSHCRGGLGRRLLRATRASTDIAVAWLQTADIDSPARRLYLSEGWTPFGHGPDAPSGRRGLLLRSDTDGHDR